MTPIEHEFIQMADRASAEIKSLRNQIADLKPRANAYDNLSIVLSLLPQKSQGYGEDVSWLLDKRASELRAIMKDEQRKKDQTND